MYILSIVSAVHVEYSKFIVMLNFKPTPNAISLYCGFHRMGADCSESFMHKSQQQQSMKNA